MVFNNAQKILIPHGTSDRATNEINYKTYLFSCLFSSSLSSFHLWFIVWIDFLFLSSFFSMDVSVDLNLIRRTLQKSFFEWKRKLFISLSLFNILNNYSQLNSLLSIIRINCLCIENRWIIEMRRQQKNYPTSLILWLFIALNVVTMKEKVEEEKEEEKNPSWESLKMCFIFESWGFIYRFWYRFIFRFDLYNEEKVQCLWWFCHDSQVTMHQIICAQRVSQQYASRLKFLSCVSQFF